MMRSTARLFMTSIQLCTAGGAELLHQEERRGAWSNRSNAGYADVPACGGQNI